MIRGFWVLLSIELTFSQKYPRKPVIIESFSCVIAVSLTVLTLNVKPRSLPPVCVCSQLCLLNFTFHFADQSLSLASSFTFFHYLSTTLFPWLNPASPPDFLPVCSLLPWSLMNTLNSTGPSSGLHQWTSLTARTDHLFQLSVSSHFKLVISPCKELLSSPMAAKFH